MSETITPTDFLEHIARQIGVPAGGAVTPAAADAFKQALERANEYRGNPEPLVDALAMAAESGSQPLFCAMMAYVHYHGAFVSNFEYRPEGIAAGWSWLKRGGDPGPAQPEVLVVKAFLEIHGRQTDEAARTLERVKELDPLNYYALTARMDHARATGQHRLVEETYRDALNIALTSTRRAYLHHRMGRYALNHNRYADALAAYQELAKLTPADPWMWHNMSIIYGERGQYEEAARCNAMALRLMDFPAARQTQRWIKQRLAELRRSRLRKLGGWAAALAVVIVLLAAIF